MKYIFAGLPKTGTKSIACALRTLGFKVLDYDEQILYYMDKWLDFFQNGKPLDFYSMFEDADVVIDLPSNIFFEEILEAFPDAKVILSERDEEAWARSWENQYKVMINSCLTRFRFFLPTFKKFWDIMDYYRMAAFGVIKPNCPLIYRKRYRYHYQHVKSVVPEEKLLVYNVKQGWKPLCEFTGKAVPDLPFPHLNVKGEVFHTFLSDTGLGKKIVGEVQVAKCVVVVLIGTMTVALWRFNSTSFPFRFFLEPILANTVSKGK